MEFIQAAPVLGNQYRDDRVLRAYLERALPREVRVAIEADLDELGAHAASAWLEARARTPVTPTLTQWDAWGERIDRIESTPVWQRGAALTARYGLVAAGHESTHREHRAHRSVRTHLPVSRRERVLHLPARDERRRGDRAQGVRKSRADRTRAAASVVARRGNALDVRAVDDRDAQAAPMSPTPRRSRDAALTVAGGCTAASGSPRRSIGEMALTLARPEDARQGNRRARVVLSSKRATQAGRWNGIRIDRLKDKLGTRELPTAELHLDGALAEPVGELANGVRLIAPMLNVTRTWNAVCALATMRRGLALALDYARTASAIRRALIEQPLHRATLAALQAEFEAAFQLGFLRRRSCSAGSKPASPTNAEKSLLRVLTPLAKLWTGKLAVRIASETCEAFGGAGYIEDTGIPQLLRDAQVYPIWEGTTNVLSLDVLRALGASGIDGVIGAADALLDAAGDDRHGVRAVLHAARDWLVTHAAQRDSLEAGARGFALTLARGFAAALLARHAAWAERERGDAHARAALAVFAAHGLSRLAPIDMDAAMLLATTP